MNCLILIFTALCLTYAVEVEVEAEAGHGDIVSALEHAVGLMDEGIGHFLSDHKHPTESPSTAQTTLGASLDFIGKMSVDVKTLHKALRKFQRQRDRDALVTKRMEAELLAAEQQVKLLQAGKLQAEELARQHSTNWQQCNEDLKGVPTGIKQLTQVQDANNDLQDKIAELQDENQQLQGQDIMLETKAREAQLLQGKVKVLQAYQERLANGIEKTVQQEVHHEESRLQDKLGYTLEVAKDLQNQDVELQKGNVKLGTTVQKLRKENQVLRADKGHLLESMQSMLQQSNECQQKLQLCSMSAENVKTACMDEASNTLAPSSEVSQVAGGQVFSAQDIAAVANADVSPPPVVFLGHSKRKLSKSLLHKRLKRGKRKLRHSKARKVAVQPKSDSDPDSVSVLDDLSLPLAPEGLGILS